MTSPFQIIQKNDFVGGGKKKKFNYEYKEERGLKEKERERGGGSRIIIANHFQTQVPTKNYTLYQKNQYRNLKKKNISETLSLKASSRLTKLVIFQGIYKKEREVKDKERKGGREDHHC